MRIAQVPTVSTPVRETGAASVESLTWLLTRELVALGHDVTVFACAGSDVPGTLVTTLPGPYAMPGVPEDWQLCEWINLTRAIEAMLDVAAPTLNRRDRRRVAASLRYFSSAMFWARLRTGFDLDAGEICDAFDRAVRTVLARLPDATWAQP